MITSSSLVYDIVGKDLEVRKYPQLIKYMGSKAKIIKFVSESIDSVYEGGEVCDLFGGACSLSGALGGKYPIHSNDIQSYSGLLASIYLKPVSPMDAEEILCEADIIYKKIKAKVPLSIEYSGFSDLDSFNDIEKKNRELIKVSFSHRYHLFLKYYSGTWWSAEQCIWIDAIKQVIDKKFKQGWWGQAEYAFAMSILMHSMAYSSQGTGHYAQYRDAKTTSSMKDINLYRQKKVPKIFLNKFNQLKEWSAENVVDLGHDISTDDFEQCLSTFETGTVYADPPYAFVHYSRFYHALETVCLYDYPNIQVKNGVFVKGRYREERHQSPFCIKTKVEGAFECLFSGVSTGNHNLALSYSNTAMISLDKLLEISDRVLGDGYKVWVEDTDHHHMTMGRQNDRQREVKELMLLARKK